MVHSGTCHISMSSFIVIIWSTYFDISSWWTIQTKRTKKVIWMLKITVQKDFTNSFQAFYEPAEPTLLTIQTYQSHFDDAIDPKFLWLKDLSCGKQWYWDKCCNTTELFYIWKITLWDGGIRTSTNHLWQALSPINKGGLIPSVLSCPRALDEITLGVVCIILE